MLQGNIHRSPITDGHRLIDEQRPALLCIRLAAGNRLHSVACLDWGLAVDALGFLQPGVNRFVDRSVTTAGPGRNQEYRAMGLTDRAIDGAAL